MKTAAKNYIRRNVWLPIARKRHQKLRRPIRYFTLTTADLYDIKLFGEHNLLELTERGYPGLGFCERDDKAYLDIIREIRSCALAYKGTFEEMALRDDQFAENFCFDVINLDFTRVPFPKRESPLEGTWGAIERVLEVQLVRKIGFDLFLTFNGRPNGTDTEAINKLSQLLCSNLEAGRGVSEFQSRVGHKDPARLLRQDYVTFLSVGFPKLLAGKAIEFGYTVDDIKTYRYARLGVSNPYDMIKFTFTLEIPKREGKKFAQKPPVVTNYDTTIPAIFSSPIVDVDKLMESEAGELSD